MNEKILVKIAKRFNRFEALIFRMKKLAKSFYHREDVVQISRELLGKFLVTKIDGIITSGMITETEAYAGVGDRASHAYNTRRTKRTEVMYNAGGTAYVYLCYGMHHLFNVITNKKNIPHAILIRSIEPVEGIEEMIQRRKKNKLDYTLTTGPGALSRAMGIYVKHTGISLIGRSIWIEDRGVHVPSEKISESKRIGVDYAGKDSLLLYRFYIKGNQWVSKHPK